FLALLGSVLAVFGKSAAYGAGYRRCNAIMALAYAGDVSMIGAIAVCLFDADRFVRVEAANALRKLLPQVKASDKQHIQPDEMNALLKALESKDGALRVAILKALEQIGDERAFPYVQHICLRYSPYQVRHAAEECLPYLRLRAAQAHQAQTLLRAS